MLKWQRDHAVSVEKAAGMSEEELQDKIITGVLHNVEKPEVTKLVSEDSLEKAVLQAAPKGTEDFNMESVKIGRELAKTIK